VVIGYIDGDNYTTGDDIGVNAFDVSTGYANIVFHTDDDGNVDYILVETSGERNLDSNEFGLTGGFALGSAPTVTASVGTKGAYTSEVPTRAQDGRSFTVKVKCESIDSNNTTLGETVTVTYNSVPKTITFTSAEVGTTKTVTFEGASGQTAVTMDADATTE
jgi:acetyltransferase-like isoleucine patch superfamily enzyme